MTGRFIKKRIKYIRLWVTSVAGALFGLLCCIFPVSVLIGIILSLTFLPVMCLCAFGKDKPKNILRQCLVMLGFSFMLCGTSTAVMLVFGMKKDVLYLFFACGLLFVFCSAVLEMFRKRAVLQNVTVTICHKEKKHSFTVLCDSGNCIIDPGSGLPVIILGKSNKKYLAEDDEKMRTLVYRTASGIGFSQAFTPEKVYVDNEMKDAGVCFVDDENLSFECKDGIIPSYLLN